jgi:hypothetical protein
MCGSHLMWVPYEYLMNPCGSRTWVSPKHIVGPAWNSTCGWSEPSTHDPTALVLLMTWLNVGAKIPPPPTLGLVKIKIVTTFLWYYKLWQVSKLNPKTVTWVTDSPRLEKRWTKFTITRVITFATICCQRYGSSIVYKHPFGTYAHKYTSCTNQILDILGTKKSTV